MTLFEPVKDSAGNATTRSTAREVSFTVYGTPVPQGSMKAFIPKGWTRPVVTGDNSKTKPWKQEIANVALDAMRGPVTTSPVAIRAIFYFDKPKSAKKRVHKTTKPDIDKLIRSLLDALTGIIFEDDSQVVSCEAWKLYASPARMTVVIRELQVQAVQS